MRNARLTAGPIMVKSRRSVAYRMARRRSSAICKVSGPADLGRSTLIAFAQGCSYRKRIEEWLGSANER